MVPIMRCLLVMECTIGGTRRHLVDLALGLADRGHEVTVAAAAERAPDFREDLALMMRRGIRSVEVGMVRSVSPLADRRAGRILRTLVKETDPDLVHTHSSKAGVLGRRAAGRTPKVHTPHTFSFLFEGEFSLMRRLAFRTLEVRLARRTDRTICVSPSEAAEAIARGVLDPARTRVVPNGVDPGAYGSIEPLERSTLGVPEEAFLVGVLGLLSEAKGHEDLFEALAARRSDLPSVHLAIAGAGDLEHRLKERVRSLGLDDSVHFLGWRDDVPRLLATLDLLAMPSHWEGMPYVLLEAMASGLPVLATDVHGCRDVVQEGVTGRLVPARDPGALGDALVGLAGDLAAADRMGQRGRAEITGTYTLDAMVDATVEVYGEALG